MGRSKLKHIIIKKIDVNFFNVTIVKIIDKEYVFYLKYYFVKSLMIDFIIIIIYIFYLKINLML